MKSLLTSFLFLTAFVLSSQTTTLKLASDVWPPFTDAKPNQALALDLVHEALSRGNVQVHTKILEFAEVIAEIRSGAYDGSAALWYSPERAAFLLFSESYLENRLILVGRKGSPVSVGTLSELKGKRIAVVESYAYGELVDSSSQVKLIKGKSDQQNLERLLKGEADYMLVDALLIEYLLKFQSKEAAEHLSIGSNTMLRRTLHFAIRRDIPGAESIVQRFNEEIRKMFADGTYNRILQLNWIETDVDGDGQSELVLSGNQAGTNEPASSYMLLSPTSQPTSGNNRYFIEGSIYEDWNLVPEKYKVPQTNIPAHDKSGFGPVFSF